MSVIIRPHRDTTIEQVEREKGAEFARLHAELRASRESLPRSGPLAEIRGCNRILDERHKGEGLFFCVLPRGHEPGDVHRFVALPEMP